MRSDNFFTIGCLLFSKLNKNGKLYYMLCTIHTIIYCIIYINQLINLVPKCDKFLKQPSFDKKTNYFTGNFYPVDLYFTNALVQINDGSLLFYLETTDPDSVFGLQICDQSKKSFIYFEY